MAAQRDIAVDGVTSFAPPPAATYRYTIELKDSKLSIWIEDRSSRQQWHKGNMAKGDYVSASNAIPDASEPDYVKCFQDALKSDLDSSSGFCRKLHTLANGARQLVLVITIRVFRSTWLATYKFDLLPVMLERIDVVESKLRDQQEELENLRYAGLLRVPTAPRFVQLEASRKDRSARLLWEEHYSPGFAVTGRDRLVRVRIPGVYTMSAIVNSAPRYDYDCVRLLVNGTSVQAAYCNSSYPDGRNKSTSLSFTTTLIDGADVAVECECALVGCSYLSIVRVGNY